MSNEKWTEDLFVEKSQDTLDRHEPEGTVSLETGLQQLEKIVKMLEQKDLPLENALCLFKEGVGLVQYCSSVLNQAEKQMGILLEGSDGELRIKAISFEMEG
jgi:exodeoxyribonuclease VII small subunit